MGYSISDMFRDYMDEHCVEEGCDIYRTGLMAKKFREVLGADTQAEKVTRDDLRAYVKQRYAEGMMGPTIRRELSIYYAAANYAVSQERIEKFAKVKPPRSSPPRRRFLTSLECEAVLAAARAAGPTEHIFHWLLFETAARKHAIEELTVDRVDLVRGVVDYRVPDVLYKNKRRGLVAISEFLRPHLEEACRGKALSDLVIGCNRKGKPLAMDKRWKAVLRAAGIDERGVNCHVARKTWASHAVKNNVDIKHVAEVLHDRVGTVDKAYAHLVVDDMHPTMNFRKPAAQ